jgi:PKD repeat protein
MRSIRNLTRLLLPLLALVALFVGVWGCTSSPTEPSGGSSSPITPKPPDPVVAYTVTVTANPGEITAGSGGSSNVTVQVRRTDNGQPPPDLTRVTLTTNIGGFGTVGGPQTLELDLINGQAQAVLFAGPESGVATIRAAATIGTLQAAGTTNVRIGEAPTFFVSSVEPSVGNSAGGENVAILGGGFQSPVRVTFNGAAATVRSVSPNRIVVTTPSASAAGVPVGVGQTATVNVAVTINVNEPDSQTDTIDRGFTYAAGGGGIQEPQVFSLDPTSGGNDGGTTVTIVGQGFAAPVQVLFGTGSSATTFNGIQAEVLSVTPNRIVVRTPAANGFGQNLTNQVVDVLVRNVNSGFSTVGAQQFKYGTNVEITAISQGSGPVSGGTRVLIQGSGFDEPVTVSFHFQDANVNVAQQVVSVSGREIVILTSPAVLPAACPADGIIDVDSISVVNIETGDGDTANIGFNYILPTPVVSNVAPGAGATGSTVVISGRNLNAGDSEVIFGDPTSGSSATVQAGSTDTALRVTVPNAPQGFTFQTQSCGANNAGTQMIPTPINITVRDLESRCLSTFRNGFLLTPPNGSCVEMPPPPPDPPTAAFSFFVVDAATHRVQFTDASTGTPTAWQWDFTNDGSFESNLRNPQFTFPAAGTYAVRLRVANAGGSDEIVQQVTVP